MIRLEDVNPDNWRLSLRVREDQESFVANSTVMLREPLHTETAEAGPS